VSSARPSESGAGAGAAAFGRGYCLASTAHINQLTSQVSNAD